jgi:hypothetical protein
MDDTLAAALLHRHGAEAIYRYNTPEEVLAVEGDVVVFDIGDSFRDKLPERYVVLDHHGVRDPAEEPSSVVQVALAVDAKLKPLPATLIHYVDLFDRYGPAVKRWAGPYGNSLNNGVARYFGDLAPTGQGEGREVPRPPRRRRILQPSRPTSPHSRRRSSWPRGCRSRSWRRSSPAPSTP